MNPGITIALLLVAALLEVGGDAIVRSGLHASAFWTKAALFMLGAVVLFAYGAFVNSAPTDFGRLLGVYVVLFFLVAQVVNRVAFGVAPTAPVVIGGAFIVLGGAIITLWRA